jgi:hypothetical protein
MLMNGPKKQKKSTLLSHFVVLEKALKIILGRGLIGSFWHEMKLAQQMRNIDETFPNILFCYIFLLI